MFWFKNSTTKEEEQRKLDVARIHKQRKVIEASAESAQRAQQLLESIKCDKAELELQLKMSDMRHQNAIDQRLQELDRLAKEVQTFAAIGGKEGAEQRVELAKLQNQLRMLEVQGDLDIDLARVKAGSAKTAIKADNVVSVFRKIGQVLFSLPKGLFDTVMGDLISAKNKTELAKEEFEKAKINQSRRLYKKNAKKR